MSILFPLGRICRGFPYRSFRLCDSSSPSSSIAPQFSKRSSQQPSDSADDKKDENFSMDWDKAWSSFKKQGRKNLRSGFSLDKYVSWNPRRSNYPLSEEVDPIKRAERSNLMLWTSPRFTLGGAIVIIMLLLIYTLLAPGKY